MVVTTMKVSGYLLLTVLILSAALIYGCDDGPTTPSDSADFKALFAHHADSGYHPGENIGFIAYVTPISFTDIASYEWDWDDGTDSESFEVPVAEHVFSETGTFSVKLTISDSAGRTSSASKPLVIVLPGNSPTAVFTFDSPEGWQPGSTIYFRASESFDDDGVISTYTWDWGDGNVSAPLTTPEASHVFEYEGDVEVRLIVEDDSGWTVTSDPQTISIGYPEGTTVLCHVDLPGQVHSLAVVGDYIYIANDWAGLKILDISSPEQPVLLPVGFTTGKPAIGLSVSGNRAIITSYDHSFTEPDDTILHLLDTTSPGDPVLISSLSIAQQEISDVALYGQYAYCVEIGKQIISIIDFTDTENPALVNILSDDEIIDRVIVQNNFLYARLPYAVNIYNLTVPANPELVSEFTHGTRDVREYFVSGPLMYVSTGTRSWLNIIDISDPANPVTLASHDLRKTTLFTVSDDILIGSDSQHPGLAIYDLSDISSPELMGYALTTKVPTQSVTSGDYIYFSEGYGISVVDFADPYGPKLIKGIGGGNTYGDVDFEGKYAYVTGVPYALEVIDLTDPESPSIVGDAFSPDSQVDGHDLIKVVDEYAYVLSFDHLMVFDVSDPGKPSITGSVKVNSGIGLDIAGDYAYVCSDQNMLSIYSISDRSNPVLLSNSTSNPQSITPLSVKVSGDYAYIAGHSTQFGAVAVFNVANPSNPIFVTVWSSGSYWSQASIGGNNLFLLSNSASEFPEDFAIYDISNPESAVLAAQIKVQGNPSDMDILGNYAYITVNDAGLMVVDFTDTANPVVISQVGLYNESSNVAVMGNLAVVTGTGLTVESIYSVVELW